MTCSLGNLSTVPTCLANNCSNPSNVSVANGSMGSCSGILTNGTSCNITCNTGYIYGPSSPVTCNLGSLTPASGYCIGAPCNPVAIPAKSCATYCGPTCQGNTSVLSSNMECTSCVLCLSAANTSSAFSAPANVTNGGFTTCTSRTVTQTLTQLFTTFVS